MSFNWGNATPASTVEIVEIDDDGKEVSQNSENENEDETTLLELAASHKVKISQVLFQNHPITPHNALCRHVGMIS